MKVLSRSEIARALSDRVSMDLDRASSGLDATVALLAGKLKNGVDLRLDAFAEIQVLDNGSPLGAGALDVPSPEAASALAGPLDGSAEESGRFLNEVLAVLREGLLNGDRIEIEGFLSLNVQEEKASVTEEDGAGRIVRPARRVISFALAPDLKTELGAQRRVQFRPDPGFRDRLARLKNSTILLVVPELDFFAKTLDFHFARAGWTVAAVTSCDEALKRVEGGEAFQVILDDPMEGSQKLLERLKGHLDTARVPCILMLQANADPNRTDSFRVCADQNVVQPFEVKALLDKAETELARVAEEEAIFRQEIHFQFATVDKMIDRANEFGAHVFERSGLDDEGQVALCAAFREAIGNSAQHGNRHRRDKIIDILYLLDGEKITVSVTDEGKGFDHRLYTNRGAGGNALAAARERHQQGRLGGLGIMLMMKCTDRLEYNEAGNSVTLTKKVPPA